MSSVEKGNIWMNRCQTVWAKGQTYSTLTSMCNIENNCLTAF